MKLPFYSEEEENLNFWTHLFGTIVSVVGVFFLVKKVMHYDDGWFILGAWVFGLSMVITFLASTLYHGVRNIPLKKAFRLMDHAAIYLLIAGTYTPFALGNLRNGWGFIIFALIWGLAISGIIFKISIRNYLYKFRHLDLFLYIALGCFVIFFIKPTIEAVGFSGMTLLAIGGAFYLVGAAFYATKRIPYNHAIWHLFVIAGAACHYFSIFYFAQPPV